MEKATELNINDSRLIAFQRLLNIMDDLRKKCPWDKKQTLQSLRYLTIEEMYELSDAIQENDMNAIQGELGDLFLHLVFYSKIGSETQSFDVGTVLNAICDKLVHRHPHIYSDVVAETEEEVKANWEKLKLKEGKKSILEGVPNSLPALVKAIRIQEKVKGVGFEWDEISDVKNKITEEINELYEAQLTKNQEGIEAEYGDVLFSLVNYARYISVNPEDALERTNKKFKKRFQLMEEMIQADKKQISEMNLQEADVYWEKAKEALK